MVQLTTVLCKAYHGGHSPFCLALCGYTNQLFYYIVAVRNRDGCFVEQLDSYCPLPKSHGERVIALNLDWIQHWTVCGAHLCKPVEWLLGLSGFFPLKESIVGRHPYR
uniref:Small ribosomal subunit protein bS16m n=1 Tax=Suricata suricatta TaxID=37032 RepID=A0A673STS0_SURSU